MNIQRIAHHLCFSPRRVKRIFTPPSLNRIEQAIAASEKTHRGQICFAVEGALQTRPLFTGQTARERAVEVFSQLRVWDTEHNNGVLIYLLLADRDIEIVADRGIHTQTGAAIWETLCREMEMRLARAQYENAILHGIAATTAHLQTHFPTQQQTSANELPNRPVIL